MIMRVMPVLFTKTIFETEVRTSQSWPIRSSPVDARRLDRFKLRALGTCARTTCV